MRFKYHWLALLLALLPASGCFKEAGNLVLDPQFTAFRMHWAAFCSPGDSYANVEQAILPGGRQVNAVRLRTGGHIMILSMPARVDERKSYRLSIWVKESAGLTGYRGLGVEPESRVGNFYDRDRKLIHQNNLWYSYEATGAEWRQAAGYLVSAELGVNWKAPADADASCLQLTSTTLAVRLRFKTMADLKTTRTLAIKDPREFPSTWLALPKIEEVPNELFKR